MINFENLTVVSVIFILCTCYIFYIQKFYANGKDLEINSKNLVINIKMFYIFCAAMFAVCVGMALFYEKYTDVILIFRIREITIFTLLWPIALVDWKCHIIPNRLLLIGLCYRGIILLFELVIYGDRFPAMLLNDAMITIAVFLICMIVKLLVKDAIGMGDVKLFTLMALFLNGRIIGAVFFSLIVSFFYALFLLVSKKKGRKDMMPFAPSIMAGTGISLLFFSM